MMPNESTVKNIATKAIRYAIDAMPFEAFATPP